MAEKYIFLPLIICSRHFEKHFLKRAKLAREAIFLKLDRNE